MGAAMLICKSTIEKLMTRPKSDIRISLKGRDGNTVRLNLTELMSGKWLVMRDGKESGKLPYGTSTEISDAIRSWVVSQKRC